MAARINFFHSIIAVLMAEVAASATDPRPSEIPLDCTPIDSAAGLQKPDDDKSKSKFDYSGRRFDRDFHKEAPIPMSNPWNKTKAEAANNVQQQSVHPSASSKENSVERSVPQEDWPTLGAAASETADDAVETASEDVPITSITIHPNMNQQPSPNNRPPPTNGKMDKKNSKFSVNSVMNASFD